MTIKTRTEWNQGGTIKVRCCYFRSSGPDHLQVSPGDVSVPEGGAAADELAELPAGGGAELPEQGVVTVSVWKVPWCIWACTSFWSYFFMLKVFVRFFYCHIACVKFKHAELACLSWKLQWKRCSFTLNVVMCFELGGSWVKLNFSSYSQSNHARREEAESAGEPGVLLPFLVSSDERQILFLWHVYFSCS